MTNNFIYVALMTYFLAIYIRRFRKVIVVNVKYLWLKIRGLTVDDEHAWINQIFSHLNKALFLVLALGYIIFHTCYWISENKSAIFNVVHNRATEDSCTEEGYEYESLVTQCHHLKLSQLKENLYLL